VSKTIDAPYASGNRGLWRKAKSLNRQEFVIVGWSDPEGSRPHLGALLLGYYADDGKLIYAGRVGTGLADKVLADLRRRLEALARAKPPLTVLPPRKTRFGSPLVLSRVHWVEPKLVSEITYLTWTADNLLRHTVTSGCGRTGLRSRFGGKPRELSDATRSSVSQGSKQPATGRSRRPGKYRPEAAWWYQYPTLAGLRK
jgi:ATP-dependent DNA ligase